MFVEARLSCLVLVLTLSASAQSTELGFTVGGGTFAAEDTGAPAYVNFGIEACGICSGRFALFGEYNHWERVGGGYPNETITRVDLLAGGLRIQGKHGIRPFFDAGLAGGWDRFKFPGGRGSHGNPGLLLGGGVAIPVRGGWYVRPQVRLTTLRGIHAGVSFGIGIGYRFPDR
jgi:hypothetical protein